MLRFEPRASNEGLGLILILDDDEVSSKAKVAKNVEALMKNMGEALVMKMDKALTKNMDEALAKLRVCYKIIVGEVDKLLDDKVGIQVTTNKDKGKKAIKEASPKSSKNSDVKSTKSDEASKEKGMPYLVAALKESIPNKDKMDVDEPTISISMKAVNSGKIMSLDTSFSVSAKHMEVTPFVEMDKKSFHLCKDAIDDDKSINFEVRATRAGEGEPWQRQVRHGLEWQGWQLG
ncbi:hypothetical protein SLEP1_g22185 [Rubroshorea leprosula]|uniref:Uncharacterized protein n=1 Tax=Rubroshorea leprosula TaxID=152421 RepID=A0AAV5JH84_9ROSI|nr:hypothetical protein SLEP1_g22185 [Rubroshorea leprosula]